MIQPTYVTFEQARWLKEKGFNVKVISFFDNDILSEPKDRKVDKFTIYNPINWNAIRPHYYSRPEQWQVVEWLRVNHNIWIEVHGWTNQPVGDEVWKECYQAFINGDATNVFIFKTPQEAYSAAFDYVLNNLI